MMEKQYTEQEINLFFTRFKQLPEYFEIEKVHQLINNPNAQAMHRVNFKYKPFKFIIMTSVFIVGLVSILFWSTTNKKIEKSELQVKDSTEIVKQLLQIDSNENESVNTKVNNVNMPIKGIETINSPINRLVESLEMNLESRKIEPLPQENADPDPEAEIIVNQEIVNSLIDNLKFIELSKDQYSKLGFDIKPDIIQIKTKGWNVFLTKQSQGVKSLGIFKWKEQKTKLIFLTDKSGVQMIKWSIIGDDKDKFEDEYFKSKIQNLVPVLLKQSDFPNILSEDQIFWFEPSDALFDALPEQLGRQVKMEYNYITAESDEERNELTTNCTYFEACKSTLKVQDCKLFPNPANTSVTIDFILSEALIGTISLANISGAKLKLLIPSTTFPKGNNSFKFDLSDLSSGIYLVLIKTNKGFKTQRLIISR